MPDRPLRGVASSLRPTVDRAKATAMVKVRFVDSVSGVLPGMGAKVSFLKKPVSEEQLRAGPQKRVPASAVIERNGQKVLMQVEQDRLSEISVSLGPKVGDEVVLEEGPEPGTRVVLAPGKKLRAGRRVKVKVDAE
jgi:multidrug efflux pump subunit AcrA (membrane-fusion protein)